MFLVYFLFSEQIRKGLYVVYYVWWYRPEPDKYFTTFIHGHMNKCTFIQQFKL